MAFIKTNKSKEWEYYYSISESYRENGTVKHRIPEYIRSIDELKAYALKGYLFMKEHGRDQNKPPPADTVNISVKTSRHSATMAMYLAAELLCFTDHRYHLSKVDYRFFPGDLLNLVMIQRAVL